MAAYQMTAADRRALANIQARERQLKARRSISSNSQTAGISQSKENANPVSRGVATVHDLGQNVDRGVYKSLEGIVDFGAGIVGAVGGLFSDDFENNVKKFIETDWTEKIMESPIGSMRSGVVGMVGGLMAHKNKLSDYSYLEEGGTIEQVAQGVGQMLPAVAISLATAGAAAPAAAGGTAASGAAAKVGALAAKNSGLLTIGASAAGTSTEEAYKDGASYGAGLGYGALSGATEMFTEKLLPGPADAVIGKSLLGGVRKGVATQGVKRVVKEVARNAINEGAEEVFSELTNPMRKSIYKGVEAFEEYADPDFYKGVKEAGKTGALTSVAFGGTVGRAIQGKGYNGDIDASIESIKALKEERSELQEKSKDGKLSPEDDKRISNLIDENYKQIEHVLKAKGVENMSDTIERYELDLDFDESGNYVKSEADTAGLDGGYYSADARGQEVSIREVLDEQGVTAYKGELTAEETEAWKETLRAHNALNKLGYVGKKLIVVDEMSNNNAFISDDVIVIGKDMLTNGEHIKRLVHETTHFTEGSAEWAEVAKHVFGDGKNIRQSLKAEIGEVIGHGYGVTDADVDAVIEHIESGYETTLTEVQGTLIEEVVANRMGNIFSDNAAVEHLCREKPTLAKRIWERIKAVLDSIGKTSAEREEIKKLRETERLFRSALETGGQEFIKDKLYGGSEGTVHYSKAENTSIKEQLREHLDEVNAMAPVASIDYTPGNKKTVFEKAFEEFKKVGFKVDRQGFGIIEIGENQIRTSLNYLDGDAELATLLTIPKVLKRGLDISGHENHKDRGYPSVTIAAPVEVNGKRGNVAAIVKQAGKNKYHTHRILMPDGSEFVFEIKKDTEPPIDSMTGKKRQRLSIDSASNLIIPQNPEKSTPKVKKSGKAQLDSDGNELSAEQEEYFRDSKVRDMNGNLLVVYHQTNADFTEFDINREGAGARDNETPHGVFLKPTSEDIGLKGRKQMRLYANIINPLVFSDRYSALSYWKRHVDGYSEIIAEIAENDKKYKMEFEECSNLMLLAKKKNLDRTQMTQEERTALIEESEELEDKVLEEWTTANTTLEKKAKALIDLYLKDNGYDGVFLRNDQGSFGRKVQTFIALSSNQVKNTDNLKPTKQMDIRYSRKGELGGEVTKTSHEELFGTDEEYAEYDKPITISDVEVLRSIGRKSINEFTSDDMKKSQEWAYKFYKELGEKSPFFRAWFGEWRSQQKKDNVSVAEIPEYVDSNDARKKNRGVVNNVDTEWDIRISREGETNTISHSGTERLSEYGLAGIQDLIRNAILLDTEVHEHHSNNAKNDAISFDHKLYSLGKMPDGVVALYKITVEEYFQSKTEPGNKRFHNLKYIKKVADITGGRTFGQNRSGGSTNGKSTTTYSIADLLDFVKEFDEEFKPKSVNEHFVSKKTGEPRVFYLEKSTEYDFVEGVRVYENKAYIGSGECVPVYVSSVTAEGVIPPQMQSDGSVIVHDAEQIKAVDNIGTFDRQTKKVRYSRKADSEGGQPKERLSIPLLNRTRFKTYTHADAEKVISSILLNKLRFNDGSSGEIGNRGELADKLYLALNTAEKGKRAGVALDIAEYIIQHTAMKGVYDDAENAEFIETVSLLKPYLHSFNLSSIYEELKHRYGKKKANGVRLLWGAPKGSGFTPDEVKSELESNGFRIDSDNVADIFFEIADAYSDATSALKKKTTAMLDEVIPTEERKQLKQDIVREILDGFEILGKPSMIATMLAEADKKAVLWKDQYYDQRNRGKAINRLFETVDRVANIVDMKKADEEIAEEVENLVKLLRKVKTYRGNIAKNVREIMKAYASETGGTKLYDLISDKLDGEINPFAAEIEAIAQGNGELSTREIEALDSILRNFIHNANNYKRVFLDGKRQEATEVIKQGVAETHEALAVKNEGLLGVANKMKEHMQSPVWRFERLGCYRSSSVMVKLWKEFQNGFDRQARFSMQVAEHYKDFFEKHKKEVDKWRDLSYEINGQKASRGQMLGLYLTALRTQGREHLFGNSDNGTVLFTDEEVTAKRGAHAGELEGMNTAVSAGDIIEFEASLTDTEREFIKLTQTFFNEISKNAKVETDEAMYGVSNVVGTDYYPLRVADDQLYRKLGDGTFRFADLFNLYSPSFNKATVEHARNKLVIENVLDVVNRHAKQMANYYGFASAVKTFNRVYNMKIDGVGNMRDAIRNVDRGFEDYVGKLIQDIQGNRMPKTGIQRTLSKVRGWGARAALAANLKVLATQFVSMPASAAVGVQYRYITKGFGMAIKRKTDIEKMFEYVPMLYDRFRNGSNIDVGLLKEGKGILGELDKLTDLTTAPIGAIDSFVCCAVWNACLEQAKGKYTPYSDEHYKAAAELTESALIKTQANYAPLYRPAILREQDSFTQLLTMFMSEPLQQFSLISSSIEKLKVTRNLAANADDAHKEEYEKLFESAKKDAAHALSAVFIDTVILTLIAQLFKWIKGKEDEDKVKGILGDFAENYVGMFPVIKDVYGYIANGYDMTNMAYTGLTNIADGLTAMYSLIDLAVSGEAYDERQVRQKGRKILLGISQTFGIPLRNLETYMIGIIEKFSPSTGIKYDDLFYSESASVYTDKLMKAVDNGNDRLADSILDIMLDEGSTDKSLRTEMRKLLGEGHDVLPRSVGETVTHNGEQIALTKRQKSRFSALYSVAGERAAKLVKTSLYRRADDTVKSSAIRFIYDTYYNLALQEVVGEELEGKNVLFAEAMDIEQLAIIVAYARSIEADKDRFGNSIAGSKKAKIERYIQSLGISAAEKYMMMGYLGYKCTNGVSTVKGYINRLSLTKAEKERLYEYCGYAV